MLMKAREQTRKSKMELDTFKKCGRCQVVKHSSDFYMSKTRKDGLMSRCKECDKQYRSENSERVNELRRKRRVDLLEHLATLPAEERELADPERQRWLKYLDENRDAINARRAAYKAENRDKINAKKAERRRYVSQATPGWATPSDFEDFRTISLMFRIYTGQPYDVDHIVPLRGKIAGQLVVCGLHCDANMTVALGVDNKRKSNQRWPDMP